MCTLDGLYKSAVPTPARMYLRGISGATDPIDETYMQPNEIDALRQLVAYQEAKKAHDDPMIEAYNAKPNRVGFRDGPDGQIEEYTPEPEKLTPRSIDDDAWVQGPGWGKLSEDAVNAYEGVRMSVGRFNYAPDDEGNMVINDHYDFNANRDPSGGSLATAAMRSLRDMSPVPLARQIGQRLVPADGKHGYPVRLNLGNPSTWQK